MVMAVDLSLVRRDTLPRSCARADGTPKVEYVTRDEARRAARLTRRDLQAYRCPYGEHYHVGTSRDERSVWVAR